MDSDRFNQLRSNRANWVHGTHWILEDHRNISTSDIAEITFFHLEEVIPLEERLTGDVDALTALKPKDCSTGDGLARP